MELKARELTALNPKFAKLAWSFTTQNGPKNKQLLKFEISTSLNGGFGKAILIMSNTMISIVQTSETDFFSSLPCIQVILKKSGPLFAHTLLELLPKISECGFSMNTMTFRRE